MTSEPIPKGGLVLVTGANGYIGSHVADQFLKQGYRVRGTARSQDKADIMTEYFDETYGKGKAEMVVVEDMSTLDAFDHVMKGVDGVAHVASDMSFGSDPDKVINIVINGNRNALKAAAKNPSVKRFVLTSSSTAVCFPVAGEKHHIDASNWNEVSPELAYSLPESDPRKGMHIYAASKNNVEKDSWKFMKEEKPHFAFTAIQPNFNIGPILHPKQQGSSGRGVQNIFKKNQQTIERFQGFPAQHMVDVKDVGLLHVAALTQPDVQNERLLAFAHPISYGQLVDVLKKIHPEMEWPPETSNDRDLYTFDTKRSEEILRRYGQDGWKSFEQSVRECIEGVESG